MCISGVDERSGQGSIVALAIGWLQLKCADFVHLETLKCRIKQVGLCRDFKQL